MTAKSKRKQRVIDGDRIQRSVKKKNFEEMLDTFKRNSADKYSDLKYGFHSRARNK